MQLHTLKNTPGARKRGMRVGRGPGSGKGKTSGRGHKGQYARSGHKHKLGFEGGQMKLVRRLPKRRVGGNPLRKDYATVNVGALSRFDAGAEVTLAALRKAGVIKGQCDGFRVTGMGDLATKLTVKAQGFSASARAKIEAAGGACEVVS